jgi:hypothetical protein
MFEPDEAMNRMTSGKAINQGRAMLMNALDQISRYADIQRSVPTARQYVNAWLIGHDEDMKRQWMPDQVRHDGYLDHKTS